MRTQNTFVLRNRHFFILDISTMICAGIFSFLIRLDFTLTTNNWQAIALFISIVVPLQLVIFFIQGMYSRYWVNAGANELLLVAYTSAIATLVTIVASVALWSFIPNFQQVLPHSIPLVDGLILTLLVTGSRFSQRAYQHQQRGKKQPDTLDAPSRIIIAGAGYTGIQVLDALERAGETTVIGFLDDDPAKAHTWVRGIKVIGKISDLHVAVRENAVSLVIISMPSAEGKVIRQIVEDCRTLGVAYKTIPSIHELVSGRITVNTLRPVSIDDLLRRPPVELDVTDIHQQVSGVCIMITGAGGSIGSELTRQIAKYKPSRLLLVGHGENSLFATEAQLKVEFPNVEYHLLLADVRDAQRLRIIFETWHPKVVFHAAAHKHVPMLESNPVEAVINNVIGTNNLIELCNRYEVTRMVMISTDKAVSPTNIMGMTKRVTEMLMMNAAIKHPRRFVAVRFGNVLGSRGSVVPTFQQQIAAGGPLTITDENITRFFMSIPEAVRLVLKASVVQNYGSLFVLNMGEPIRILDLAHDLIRLNGLRPEHDIEIKITGLRRGEKLYEELFWPYEGHQKIENDAMFAIQLPGDIQDMFAQQLDRIQLLMQAARNQNAELVCELLPAIVFTVPDVVRQEKPNANVNQSVHALSPM